MLLCINLNRNGDKSLAGQFVYDYRYRFFLEEERTVMDVRSFFFSPHNGQRIDANTDALPFQLWLCS